MLLSKSSWVSSISVATLDFEKCGYATMRGIHKEASV